MGQTPSKNYHVYRIQKCNGNSKYTTVWPTSETENYCTDEANALLEFENLSQTGKYRLVQYQTVLEDKIIIGITGDGVVIKEN